MLTINSNTTALMAQNNLSKTQDNLTASMTRLSTGLRINSAADDAAGMQISNRMQTQINGLGVAQSNAGDAISLVQTAEGAMKEDTTIMNRMRDLSLQAANGTNSSSDRGALQKEVSALTSEMNRIASDTTFAGKKLLNGDASAMTFQIGSGSGETIGISIGSMSASDLSGTVTTHDYSAAANNALDTGNVWKDDGSGAKSIVDGDQDLVLTDGNGADLTIKLKDGETDAAVSAKIAEAMGLDASAVAMTTTGGTTAALDLTAATGPLAGISKFDNIGGAAITSAEATETMSVADIDISTAAGAQAAIQILDGAMTAVDSQRADLGAIQNRLNSTMNNLSNVEENMGAAHGRITSTDFAKETVNLTSQQMLLQAGSTVLSQAKGMPQYAAQLL